MRPAIRHATVLCLAAAAASAGPHSTTNGRRLAIGPGNLLVLTDPRLDRVILYDVSGERPRKRVAFGVPGIRLGQLDSPHGAAVSARGDLLVADTLNHRIQDYDLTAVLYGWPPRLLRSFGSYGDGPAELNAPQSGIVLPPDENRQDRAFVADTRNQRVLVFALTGRPTGLVIGAGRLDTPAGIALDSRGERLYVAEAGSHRVSAFAADTGAFLFGFGQDVLATPAGIAVDRQGDVLVTDLGTRRVHRFRPDRAGARAVGAWGRTGTGAGEWTYPQSIAVDAQGRVYVCDLASDRCQMFGADGAFLAAFGDDVALGYPPDAPPTHGEVGTPVREACSNAGRYHVSVRAPDPFPVNALFDLEVTVEEGCDPPRRPAAAALHVDAFMPEHRHGMTTEPVVVPRGDGRFTARGLLLHMPGRWEMYFDATDGGVTERTQLDFILE